MKKTLVVIGIAAAFSLFLNSTNYLYSSEDGAPAARTGAPRATTGTESTCAASGCHGSNLNVGPNSAGISIQGQPESFEPGGSYTITASIVGATGSAGGFQMVVLNPSRASSGTFTPGPNTKIVSLTGRAYITHTNPNNRSWTFTWNAPAVNAPDSVTFYMAAMETIPNSFRTYTTRKVFRKLQTTTSIAASSSERPLLVFPTYASDKLTIQHSYQGILPVRIEVLGTDGKEVLRQEVSVTEASAELELPSSMKQGAYLLRVVSARGIQVRRFVKI